MFTDNPIRDFEKYDQGKEERLENLPVCDQCGEHIQDDYMYVIGDYTLCEECLKDFREAVYHG